MNENRKVISQTSSTFFSLLLSQVLSEHPLEICNWDSQKSEHGAINSVLGRLTSAGGVNLSSLIESNMTSSIRPSSFVICNGVGSTLSKTFVDWLDD